MTRIITKHSTTAGAVPTASQLEVGELAVNTADNKVFTKHTDGSIRQVAGSGATQLAELLDVSNNAPATGQLLRFNGTEWIAQTVFIPSKLTDLADVDLETTAPVAGNLLKYTTSGWTPSAFRESGSSLLGSNGYSSVSLGAQAELISTTGTAQAYAGIKSASNAQAWFNSGGAYSAGTFKVLGGSAGTLYFYVNTTATNINGNLLPTSDNTRDVGSASFRMRQIYAGTATINTSDEREKQDIEDIPQEWLDAWGAVQYQRFRFRDSVAVKGNSARIHIGLIAQRVKEAFESRGLDPFAIGILCWDAWEESTTEDGEVVPAGDRYGIRYEEALALECAYLRQQLQQLKA